MPIIPSHHAQPTRAFTPSRKAVDSSLIVFAITSVSIGLGASIALTAEHGHDLTYLLGGVLSAALLGMLCVIPVRLLPATALLVTLFIPTDTTLLPHLLQGSALGVIPLAAWIIRAPTSRNTPSILQALACLLGIWMLLCEIFAPVHTHHGWEWFLTALITLVFAVVTAPTGLRPQSFRSLFIAVSTVLGIYALLEGFLLHNNILFGTLFEHSTWWADQQRGASYRATTLLGHPLINGTVFSAAAVLAASNVVQKPRASSIALTQLIILIGATAATHSRGAAIALIVGLVMVIAFSRRPIASQDTRRFILTLCVVIGGGALLYGLKARNESKGGQLSTAVRVNVIKRASQTLHGLEPFGAGPGESEAYRTIRQLPEWETDLENSYAELVVSLGPVGLSLVIILLIAVIIFGLQNGLMVGEAAALFTMALDIGGFNAIEDHKPVLVILALFIIAIITAPRAVEHTAINGSTAVSSSDPTIS